MKKGFTKKFKTSPLVNPWVALSATLPALLAIVLLALVPSIVNVVLSFTNYSKWGQAFEWVGLKNYIDAFTFQHDAVTIWRALGNTLIFAAFTVIIQQIISLGSALLVSRKFKGRSFFRALYFMPTILGVSVVGFIWQLILTPYEGPVYKILELFGIRSGLLGQEKVAMALVIMVAIWANFGYAMAIYVAGLNDIPNELKEAAEIDGVTKMQMFRYITMPLLKNTLVINFWISISGTLAMFDIIYVLNKGAAGTTTFALYIFDIATRSGTNKGQGAVLSIYFFVFVTIIMLAFNALFRRKEAND